MTPAGAQRQERDLFLEVHDVEFARLLVKRPLARPADRQNENFTGADFLGAAIAVVQRNAAGNDVANFRTGLARRREATGRAFPDADFYEAIIGRPQRLARLILVAADGSRL